MFSSPPPPLEAPLSPCRLPAYRGPTDEELEWIERELFRSGVAVRSYRVDMEEFRRFKEAFPFGDTYYGGPGNPVYEEKLLEHFVCYDLGILHMGGRREIYVDVASADSPWVYLLRKKGCKAFAIDAKPPDVHLQWYYRTMDATRTSFADGSVACASLQCAFEMFAGDDDRKLVRELGRILRKGGRAIICPLYLHTHYCGYCSPEYADRTEYHDPDAVLYVESRYPGIPFSRKYDPVRLKERILSTVSASGMEYNLYVLRNRTEVDTGSYCHFILEIRR